jgi:Ca2+-binding EF-hand superfamily protein
MWSYGVIVFRLLFGYLPFTVKEAPATEDELLAKMTYEMCPKRLSILSEASVDFVKRLLVADPDKRLRLEDALRHQWLKSMEGKVEKLCDSTFLDDLIDYANMSQTRRACMFLMVWSLPTETRQKMRPKFLSMDRHHDGKVTLAELKDFLQAEWDMTDNDISVIFHALDVSGDGVVTCAELEAAMVSGYIKDKPELLKAAFHRFEDSSGTMTKDHLTKILGKDAQAERMLRRMDLDNNGEVSFEEFQSYILKGHDHLRNGKSERFSSHNMVEDASDRAQTEWADTPWRPDVHRREKEPQQSWWQSLIVCCAARESVACTPRSPQIASSGC